MWPAPGDARRPSRPRAGLASLAHASTRWCSRAELDDVGGQALRVTAESVERRLAASTPSPRVHQAARARGHSGVNRQQPLLLSWVSSLPEVNGAWPSRLSIRPGTA